MLLIKYIFMTSMLTLLQTIIFKSNTKQRLLYKKGVFHFKMQGLNLLINISYNSICKSFYVQKVEKFYQWIIYKCLIFQVFFMFFTNKILCKGNKMVFFLQFCWQPIKGLNMSTNWRENTIFPCQSKKIFTFRVKLGDLIFFLLGHSPIVKLI